MSIAICRFCLGFFDGAGSLCRERKKERDAELRQVLEGQTARMVELLDNHQKLQVCCFLLLFDSSSIWYVMTPLCCHTSCWTDSEPSVLL